jgi:hypothetical protein
MGYTSGDASHAGNRKEMLTVTSALLTLQNNDRSVI